MNKTAALILGGALLLAAIIVAVGGNRNVSVEPMRGHMQEAIDDKAFLVNMIPHHQEAVDTANEVLERGGVIPEVKTLAENIIEAQEREIADMKTWYETWYGEPYSYSGGYQPMMRELADLSGKELDLIFTNDMWMHHMGAIHLAQAVLQNTDRPELIKMGNDILVIQRQEMMQMQQILAEHSND